MGTARHPVVPPCEAGPVHDVDEALQVIGARDPTAAKVANGLWGALRTGAAHERVTRYDVQGVCWGALPNLLRRPDAAAVLGDRHTVAALLAELLELLGYPRYAELCLNATTAKILDAADDVDACTALAATAWKTSGVEPPNTTILTWAQVRGPVEQALHAGTGRLLEEAIDDGFIDLTRQDADLRRAALTMKVLSSPAENRPGTWFAQLFEERITTWLTEGGSQTRRELLVRVRPEVTRPPESSPCHEFPALQLLLEACRDGGLRLTRNGYLPTALVGELVELMPAGADYPGRSESSCPPVRALREIATELGLVRRDGPRLRLTPMGQDRVEDTDSLVMSVGEGIVTKVPSKRGVIEEVILAILLLENEPEVNRMLDRVTIVADEQEWTIPEHLIQPHDLAFEYGGFFLRRLYTLGALDTDDTETRVGLTEAGRAAARWALRARVMLRVVLA